MKNIFIGASLLFLASACGQSASGTNTYQQTSQTMMSYQLVDNGCDTDAHYFHTRQEYCDGVRDSTLNHGCAEDARKDLFRLECQGFGNF